MLWGFQKKYIKRHSKYDNWKNKNKNVMLISVFCKIGFFLVIKNSLYIFNVFSQNLNKIWVSDITESSCFIRWTTLCKIIDCGGRNGFNAGILGLYRTGIFRYDAHVQYDTLWKNVSYPHTNVDAVEYRAGDISVAQTHDESNN